MCYTLPRELRDMIYGFLHWNRSTPNPRALAFRCGSIYSDDCGPGEQKPWNHPFTDSIPYWNRGVVGTQFFREMVETWYKLVVIDFWSLLTGTLFDYIGGDRWSLGLTPSSFVRHVVVIIDAQDVHKHGSFDNLDNLDSFSHLQTGFSVHMILWVPKMRYGNLDYLNRSLPRPGEDPKHVDFRLFASDEVNVRLAIYMWQALLRTLRHLQGSGIKLHVTVSYGHARLALYRHGQGMTLSEDHCRSVIEATEQVSTIYLTPRQSNAATVVD